MPTMFAAYDYHGKTEPRFFPLADTAETTATIATRAYDLGIGIKKDGIMREIVGISGDTALIHFGTLVRFSGRSKLKMLAMYAVGASDDDKNALIRMAEIASIDKSFMTGMWEHFQAARRSRDGEQLSEQDHLHIALVTDLQAPARYAATAKDSGVSL